MDIPLPLALVCVLPILSLLACRLHAQTRRVRAMERQLAHADTLARTDPLTSLLNRTAYEERLATAEGAARTGRRVCCAMLDIDDFKRVNDKKGHHTGDQALKLVASALRHTFYEDGHAFYRVGGDEFALILQGLSQKEVAARFHLFRSLITQAGVSLDIPLSVAVGYVFWGEAGAESIRSAFRAADAAMYEDKKQKM